jgi:hypothetical protein
MLHPEFGYFCPTARLRRDVRVAFCAIIFGALIGSVTVAALSTRGRNSEAESATLTNARVVETATRPDRNQGSRTEIPAVNATPPSESQIFDDQASRTAYPLVTATVEPGKRASNLNGCEENSSPTAQGQCASEKFGPVRVRSVNNPPEIARIPLGRTTALEAAAPMGAPGNNGSANLELQTSQVAQSPATTSPPVGAEDARGDRPRSGAESRKQSYRVARAQNPHHRGRTTPTVRRNRENGFGGLGRAYAFDGAYGRTGFWYWSW